MLATTCVGCFGLAGCDSQAVCVLPLLYMDADGPREVGAGQAKEICLEITFMSEQMIKVQLPDGSVREVSRGTTPYDIAMSISPRLAAAVVVARIRPLTAVAAASAVEGEEGSEASMYGAAAGGERVVDLTAPLNEDVALELLKETDEAALKVVRHSAAHVMATAILELFPETKLGHGPATDVGVLL